MTEQEIAAIAVAELQRLGYETYEEVRFRSLGKIADIVGLRGPVILVLEAKRSMTLALLNQIMYWERYAHQRLVCVEKGRIGLAVTRLLRNEGIGLWRVGRLDGVKEELGPVLRRKALTDLRDYCVAENRSGSEYASAGSKGGGYWTPFQGTKRALDEVVKKNPGIALWEALEQVDHHYASSQSGVNSMANLIQRGVIKTIRIGKWRPIRVWPVEEKEEK
jgi:hypothetical protein